MSLIKHSFHRLPQGQRKKQNIELTSFSLRWGGLWLYAYDRATLVLRSSNASFFLFSTLEKLACVEVSWVTHKLVYILKLMSSNICMSFCISIDKSRIFLGGWGVEYLLDGPTHDTIWSCKFFWKGVGGGLVLCALHASHSYGTLILC